jgi:hypothetical protein
VSPVFTVSLGSMRTTSAPATDTGWCDTARHDVQLAGTEPDVAVVHPDGQFAGHCCIRGDRVEAATLLA